MEENSSDLDLVKWLAAVKFVILCKTYFHILSINIFEFQSCLRMAQNSLVNMLNVPARLTARKRSGSFSEVLARSLSTERPGTPRPKEMVRLIIFSFYDHPLPSTISLDLGLTSNVELCRLYNTKYLRKLLDILTSLLVASRNL